MVATHNASDIHFSLGSADRTRNRRRPRNDTEAIWKGTEIQASQHRPIVHSRLSSVGSQSLFRPSRRTARLLHEPEAILASHPRPLAPAASAERQHHTASPL